MPPREVPLPDYPDDWPHDRTYPQFEGQNLTRGWWSEFVRQKPDDDNDEFSDFEEKLKEIEERDRKKQQAQQAQQGKKTSVAKPSAMQKTTRDPLTAKVPSTLKSKSAASALSKPRTLTAASKARTPATTVTSKKPAISGQIPAGNSRHIAARVASNTTLGYSKGRAVSANNRTPLSNIYEPQSMAVEDHKTSPEKKAHPAGSSLDDLFGINRLDIDDEDDALRDFHLDPIV